MSTKNVLELISSIDKFPIERTIVPQNQLDLVNRNRTSLFPWRGQFSPELIELLLSKYTDIDSVVVDPFVGSGTTLFEAARRSLTCFGAEINPAAVEMSRTVHFANVPPPGREKYLKRAKMIIEQNLSSSHRDLFSFQDKGSGQITLLPLEDTFVHILHEASEDPFVYNIVMNSIMSNMLVQNNEPGKLLEMYNKHASIVRMLPYSRQPCKVFHCDARDIPLDTESVGFIVTSPPYINVFNYHQNYRGIMELADWDLLQVAKSEIGSNRKNRGNRFLTVIQYSIDMLQALQEMRRIISSKGRIVIVIGRVSKVRGIRFENYRLLSTLAAGGAGLRLICRQERKFVNRFGKTIYEDLLHFTPIEEFSLASDSFSRNVALCFLKEALDETTDSIRQDTMSAIENINDVTASPMFYKESTRFIK